MSSVTIDTLTACPLFEGFQPKHLDRLLALAAEDAFAAGEIIFREGEDEGRFYVVLDGRVALEAGPEDRPFVVEILYAGEELGWSSVMSRPKRFRARALEPVRALRFDAAELRDACHRDPYFGLAVFERLFLAATDRLQSNRLRLVERLAPATPRTTGR